MIFSRAPTRVIYKRRFFSWREAHSQKLEKFLFLCYTKIVYYIGGIMSEETKLMLGLAGIIFLPFILMLFNFIWNKVEDFIEKRRKKK